MHRVLFVLALLAIGHLGLGACHLYLGHDDGEDDYPEMWPDDCSAIDCGNPDEPGDEVPDEEEPPLLCETDEECGPGCYCNDDSLCEESSLCRLNQDCADGFHCSEAGCVPDDDPPPPATCEELSDNEDGCLSDESCSPVYRGINCTSETGETCTSESADCTCESFSFDSCEDA